MPWSSRYFGPVAPISVARPHRRHAPGRPSAPRRARRLSIACRCRGFTPPVEPRRLGPPGSMASEVAMDLLGTGRASRLHRALVREQQVAQDVDGFAFPEIGGAAVFVVAVTARPASRTRCWRRRCGVRSIVWRPRVRPTRSWTRARNLHAAGVESDLERAAERAHRLSMYAALFDEAERINSAVDRYVSVDAARVREAMTLGLRPDNRACSPTCRRTTPSTGRREASLGLVPAPPDVHAGVVSEARP